MKLSEAIDTIFSHNEIIAVWERVNEREHKMKWRGMGWELPDKYKNIKDWKVFGVVPETINEADTINIKVVNNMPKCSYCDCELEYSYWTDEENNKHDTIIYKNFKYLDILQCPNCKKIYGLEMKF